MPAAKGDGTGKRKLVRWDDDKDKQLLLALQYTCANAGIRIPWDDVAKQLGDKFSGGACVQHLAKLRSRMQEEGMEVPPPLARGIVTNKPSSIYKSGAGGGTRKRKPKVDDFENDVEEQPLMTPPPTKKRKSIKKEPGIKEESDEEAPSMPDLYDSDGDDYAASARKKSMPKPKSKKGKKNARTQSAASAAESTPDTSPTMRTRGNRVTYFKQTDLPVDDEEIAPEATPATVKTEDSATAPGAGTRESESITPANDDQEPTPRPLPQQMGPPASYYQDFGGFNPNIPGYNPAYTFGNPSQSLWGAPNLNMQQYMYNAPQAQQQQESVDTKSLNSNSNLFGEPLSMPFQNSLFPYQTSTANPRGMPAFDFNLANSMFNVSPVFSMSSSGGAFKKTSVSQLKSADSSRNNSTDSVNTQDTLQGVPQQDFGYGLGLGVDGTGTGAGTGQAEVEAPSYTPTFDIRELVDWEQVEKANAESDVRDGVDGV